MAQRFAAARIAARSLERDSAHDVDLDHAPLSSRILAYLIDSIALAGISLLFFAAAGVNVYVRSDGGRETLSDAAITDSFLILMATIPVWLLLSLALDIRGGQSVGKYVIGLQAVGIDGRPAGPARHLLHWLALHPLLFHPFIGVFFASFAIYSVSFAESSVLLFSGLAMTLLCILAPVASLFFALGDSQRRGIHDWLAAMKVVRT